MALSTPTPVVLLLLLALPAVYSQQCDSSAGCFPSLGNLALGRSIQVSSTCTTSFCTPPPSSETLACNGSQYQSVNINDGNMDTYWVSQVGSNISLPVTLQLNFEGPVLFDSTTISWHSSRPDAMNLEYSQNNGSTWLPYRYYSNNCTGDFNLNDTVVTPESNFTGSAAVCTSIGLLSGQASFLSSSHFVVDRAAYQTVTNLRLQLDRVDVNLLLPVCSQHFAVSEWNVQGSCMCNGHAGTCAPLPQEPVVPDKVYAGCMCAHNTTGPQCNECEVGFNRLPWRAGTESDANVCEACQCFSHADDCIFEESNMTAVCINCTDNTSGVNCEQCLPTYHPNSTLMMSDPSYCTPCRCDVAGAMSQVCDTSGQCTCKSAVDSATLKCSECRDGYWNLSSDNPLGCIACDCNAVGAQLVGNATLCDKTSGTCLCRTQNIVGDRCSECMAGFFGLSDGCSNQCNCDPVGSTGSSCNITTGQCSCKPNVEGLTCNRPVPGHYFRSLDIIFEAEEATFTPAFSLLFPLVNSVPEQYTGRGFVSASMSGNVTFVLSVPKSSQYEVLIRYQVPTAVTGVSATVRSLIPVTRSLQCVNQSSQFTTFEQSPVTLPSTGDVNGEHCFHSLCLEQGATYELTVRYNPAGDNEMLRFDSIVARPDVEQTSAYFSSLSVLDQITVNLCLSQTIVPNPDPNCLPTYFRFSVEFYDQVFECQPPSLAGVANITSVCDSNGGAYTCRDGFTGMLCDRCENGFFNETVCEACGCDSVGSMSLVCNQQTGQCPCRPGVSGEKCSSCLDDYYGFSSNGCTSCDCSTQYALSAQCNETGQCPCQPGVGGLTCGDCSDGFFNITTSGCQPCVCNSEGSTSNVCNKTTGQCPCIGDATGIECDLCPDNQYRTEGMFQPSCVSCVCSGFSQQCIANNATSIFSSVESSFGELCAISQDCSDGWQLLNSDGTDAAPFGPSSGEGLGYILLNGMNPMLHAPDKFLGDQRRSYLLPFEVTVVKQDSAVFLPTGMLQVTLEGSMFTQPLVGELSDPVMNDMDTYTFSILMNETLWRVGSAQGNVSTLSQFLAVISNITSLRFSAKFTQAVISFVHIRRVNLNIKLPREEADLNNITGPAITVEMCDCPQGMVGSSCDECAVGYYRPSGNPADPCLPCQCNNQTQTCDQRTGVCTNCGSNTTGNHCQQCLPGFFGNITSGISCQPCQCPFLNKNFSPTCILDSDGNHTCDQCGTGYAGRRCDMCANGYFGNPLMDDGVCNDCQCNNNVDPALGLTCDMISGQCLNCQNHTRGFFCQHCDEGYHGDVLGGIPCQQCRCNTNGTAECDILDGTCYCKPNVTGALCTECLPRLYGDPANNVECLPCECSGSNASPSSTCFLDNDGMPTCDNCSTGYTGRRCELCTNGYYRQEGECVECDCNGNVDPSLGLACNMTTGQCLNCQNNTFGFRCQFCQHGFFGDATNGNLCQACSCHPDGINSDRCDMIDGTCFCLPHTTGDDCSQCEPGYWNLTAGVGCSPCECCSNGSMSTTCDQITGDCECLPGVGGSADNKCCQCSHGFFNFTIVGCQDCGCGELSASPQCDDDGVCDCINGGSGSKCEGCEAGYIGLAPNCSRCHECFFIWNDTLDGTRTNVTFLLNRINEVLQYYRGFNVSEIERVILEINNTVTMISDSLNEIMPNHAIADSIENMLEEINAASTMLTVEMEKIGGNLNDSETVLMTVRDFVTALESGGMFPVPVDSIYANITMLNRTIHTLERGANASYALIQQHYARALNVTMEIDEIMSQANQALAVILAGNTTTATANSITSNFTSLVSNFSLVDSDLKSIQQWISSIGNGTAEVNTTSNDLSVDVNQLEAQLGMINSTLMRLSNLTAALSRSAEQVMLAADQQLYATRNLSDISGKALNTVMSLLGMTEVSSEQAGNISRTLQSTNATAQELMSLPSLPTDTAEETARNINDTIIPEEVTQELQAVASNSSSIANNTLIQAEQAKMAVDALNETTNEITSNLQYTQAALTQCISNTGAIGESVRATNATLQQAESASAEVSSLTAKAREDFDTTNNSITEAKQLEQDVTDTVEELQNTANTASNTVQAADQVLQDAKANQSDIHEDAVRLHSEAEENSDNAKEALSQAQALSSLQSVKLQRLRDLIANYTTKQEMVNQLRNNITELRKELENVTVRLREASDRYKRCYKTP